MAALRTEFPFTLPKGYVDADGSLHRHGTMRLSTARDEIEPLRSRDIDGPDDPYLTVLVLARVITELGSLPQISTVDVENLFAADLAFLQDLYGIINFGENANKCTVAPGNDLGKPFRINERFITGDGNQDSFANLPLQLGDMHTKVISLSDTWRFPHESA